MRGKGWLYRALFLLFFLAGIWMADTMPVYAAEGGPENDLVDETMLENFDFSEIEAFLSGQESTGSISFRSLLQQILSQEEVDKQELFGALWHLIAGELTDGKTIFVQLLILCAAFAILHNFASVFPNSQIHTASFYMFFLALITLLMRSYVLVHQILTEVLGNLVDFMEALIPAFCLALMFSSAASTAAVVYQIIVAVIYLIERILLYLVVPGVHIFVVLQMLNHMTGEVMISKITSLLKRIITWGLRIMVAAITGMNILQSLIAPALDGLKHTAVTKTLNMIPGLGGSASAVTSMFLGSAVVIKNGIGVAALVILLILCLGPLIKMGALTLLYKLAGAVVEPISDKRVCNCISSVGEGAGLLMKVLFSAMMMFMVTIAIITAAVR